jgi:hypothetical protein
VLAFVFVSTFLRGDGATACNLSLITPVEASRPLEGLPSALHGPLYLPAGLLLLYGLPLFKEPLALGKSHLDLRPRPLEVDLQGHNAVAPLGHLARQAPDLALVQEELSRPQGLVVRDVSVAVRAYVGVDEQRLSALYGHVAVFKVRPALPEGLHLSPQKGDASLEGLLDVVIVVRLPVLADYLHLLFYHNRRPRRGRPGGPPRR